MLSSKEEDQAFWRLSFKVFKQSAHFAEECLVRDHYTLSFKRAEFITDQNVKPETLRYFL